MIQLVPPEFKDLQSKFSSAKVSSRSRTQPKDFTGKEVERSKVEKSTLEKGLRNEGETGTEGEEVKGEVIT